MRPAFIPLDIGVAGIGSTGGCTEMLCYQVAQLYVPPFPPLGGCKASFRLALRRQRSQLRNKVLQVGATPAP
eukprot:9117985-Alexandrium_andersonii.AAC.1